MTHQSTKKIQVHQKSHWITLPSKDELHLRRIYANPEGIPIFMLHGSVENGRIFYTESGKGLAPYLASHGFDVFVADLRGRGKSRPAISRGSKFGQFEAITEDIPAFIEKVREFYPKQKIHWVAHSWGGVLAHAFWARYPEQIKKVASFTGFGSRRRVKVRHLKQWLLLYPLYYGLGQILSSVFGYLPTASVAKGFDNESKKFYLQTRFWALQDQWIEKVDHLDHPKILKKMKMPPSLFLTGAADPVLGNVKDIEFFMQESNHSQASIKIIGKETGFRHDYGHIDLLTHPGGPKDHFKMVLEWLNGLESR